jgi:hypothetical protein
MPDYAAGANAKTNAGLNAPHRLPGSGAAAAGAGYFAAASYILATYSQFTR